MRAETKHRDVRIISANAIISIMSEIPSSLEFLSILKSQRTNKRDFLIII